MRHDCSPTVNARYILALRQCVASQEQATAKALTAFCSLIAITRALLPEATNALPSGSDSWLHSPLPWRNAPLTHPVRPLLAVCLHAKRNSKPRLQSQSVDRLLFSHCHSMCIATREATNVFPSGSDSWPRRPTRTAKSLSHIAIKIASRRIEHA